jgi:hypothetical protein
MIKDWQTWFNDLWLQPVEDELNVSIGSLEICIPSHFSPMLDALHPNNPIKGSIRAIQHVEPFIKNSAPFSIDQRSNKGYIKGSFEAGYPVEWDPLNCTFWVHSLHDLRSIWIAPSIPATWDWAAPFRSFYNWHSLILDDTCIVHAAVASFSDKALLFTGKGFAGKSTTMASLLNSGWKITGEDYVLIEPFENSLYASSIYKSMKIRADSPFFTCLPLANTSILEFGSSEERLALSLSPELVSTRVEIVGVITIDSSCTVASLQRVSLHEALQPMIYSSIKQVAGGHLQLLQNIRSVFNILPNIPAYRIGKAVPISKMDTLYKPILETK